MDYYEKRYKDLIEAVKKLQETNPSDEGIQNWVNDNVPELKESEDERIRKALKEYFINSFQNNGVAAILGVHIKDILAWLEKQGEQKPAWKPADGDDLPKYDREVIVLYQPSNLELEKTEYCVSFAHRPNPDGWDGKSMLTGKIEHYTPKVNGKGGWNIPDVIWWLDADLPNTEE